MQVLHVPLHCWDGYAKGGDSKAPSPTEAGWAINQAPPVHRLAACLSKCIRHHVLVGVTGCPGPARAESVGRCRCTPAAEQMEYYMGKWYHGMGCLGKLNVSCVVCHCDDACLRALQTYVHVSSLLFLFETDWNLSVLWVEQPAA